MSRIVVDLDDEALSLASEELGTKSEVATVNAAPADPRCCTSTATMT